MDMPLRTFTMSLTVTVRESKHGRMSPAEIRREIRHGIEHMGEFAGIYGDERIRVKSLRPAKRER